MAVLALSVLEALASGGYQAPHCTSFVRSTVAAEGPGMNDGV